MDLETLLGYFAMVAIAIITLILVLGLFAALLEMISYAGTVVGNWLDRKGKKKDHNDKV